MGWIVDSGPGVLIAFVTAVTVGAVAWLFAPFRRRLERQRTRLTGDHGVLLKVASRPDELAGIMPREMLDLRPEWLNDPDYYFAGGVPDKGPATRTDWDEWVAKRGGLGVGWRHVLLRIQATQDRTVLLLDPRVVAIRTPVAGGIVLGPMPDPGGNGLMCRQFSLHLDTGEPPKYHSVVPGETPQFKMAKGDSEAILLIVRADEGFWEWTVEVRMLVDGDEVTLKADDNGRPFVTVGAQGLERRWWSFESNEWRDELRW